MDHNPKGMIQTILLPFANQCPCLGQERSIQSVKDVPVIGNIKKQVDSYVTFEFISEECDTTINTLITTT